MTPTQHEGKQMSINGGPAFPRPGAAGGYSDGMSMLDYFAAHAPDHPTWEFDVEMATPRPKPEFPTSQHKSECSPSNFKEIDDWDREHSRQRAIQWPWVYAHAMLGQRG